MSNRQNPFRGYVFTLSKDEFIELEQVVRARRCKEDLGFATFEEVAQAYRADPRCPYCGSRGIGKDGYTKAGRQRYHCKTCDASFSSLSGTIFEYGKKDLATWVDFVRLMSFNVPLDAIAEICRITHQSAHEWRHRVFATVDGYQDRIVLRSRIWVDEIYVRDADLTHGFGQARKRGLSKQQLCIAVAIDVHKNVVAKVCGHGKPSGRRIKDALASHMEKGAVIVGDREKAHRVLAKAVDGVFESYKADVKDAVYLECMALVNSLCSWLKRYLWHFIGMDTANIQSYLNWYVYLFRVNKAKDKWPKTERLIRHLMMTDAHYRT